MGTRGSQTPSACPEHPSLVLLSLMRNRQTAWTGRGPRASHVSMALNPGGRAQFLSWNLLSMEVEGAEHPSVWSDRMFMGNQPTTSSAAAAAGGGGHRSPNRGKSTSAPRLRCYERAWKSSCRTRWGTRLRAEVAQRELSGPRPEASPSTPGAEPSTRSGCSELEAPGARDVRAFSPDPDPCQTSSASGGTGGSGACTASPWGPWCLGGLKAGPD